MYLKISTFLLFLILLAGCTTAQKMYEQNFKTAQINSVSLSALDTTMVDFNQTYFFNLGGDKCKRCVDLDGHKSFALKLQVKDNSCAYALKIKTKVNNAVFAPKVLLLNQNNKVVKSYLAQDFTFDRGMFKKTIFINKPKDIQSILIAHDQSEITHDRNITRVDVNMISTGYFYYYSASGDKKMKLENALGGNIEVKLDQEN